MADLEKIRVAILVDDGFEQAEMAEPRKALEESGAETVLVSPQKDKVRGWENKDWGEEFPVQLSIDGARADSFDALLLPGGVMNPDHLRMNPAAVAFVRAFFDADFAENPNKKTQKTQFHLHKNRSAPARIFNREEILGISQTVTPFARTTACAAASKV